MDWVARHNNAWPLEDVYAMYGREVLAEAATDPELAAQVDVVAGRIEDVFEAHRGRHRRRSEAGYAYLIGVAAGRRQEMLDHSPELDASDLHFHGDVAVVMAAVCQTGIRWGLLKV